MASNAQLGKIILLIAVVVFFYYFFWVAILPFMILDEGEYQNKQKIRKHNTCIYMYSFISVYGICMDMCWWASSYCVGFLLNNLSFLPCRLWPCGFCVVIKAPQIQIETRRSVTYTYIHTCLNIHIYVIPSPPLYNLRRINCNVEYDMIHMYIRTLCLFSKL